jgi:hypothetical protein
VCFLCLIVEFVAFVIVICFFLAADTTSPTQRYATIKAEQFNTVQLHYSLLYLYLSLSFCSLCSVKCRFILAIGARLLCWSGNLHDRCCFFGKVLTIKLQRPPEWLTIEHRQYIRDGRWLLCVSFLFGQVLGEGHYCCAGRPVCAVVVGLLAKLCQ